MTPRPPHPLDDRYPGVAYLFSAYVMGDEAFEDELHGYVVASDDPALRATTDELRQMLSDPDANDEELTRFVEQHSWHLVDGSGRRTIEAAVAYFEDAIRNPKPRHWLAPRVPTLTRLLYEHTRSTDDLDRLVREGARALGPEATRAARAEIAALLNDPTLSLRDLSSYVAVHSYWLVASNGRLTLERIAAVLDDTL